MEHLTDKDRDALNEHVDGIINLIRSWEKINEGKISPPVFLTDDLL